MTFSLSLRHFFVSLIKTEDNVENAEAETDAAADEEGKLIAINANQQ